MAELEKCPRCKGTGEIFFMTKGEDVAHDICPDCEGRGLVPGKEEEPMAPLPFWPPNTKVRIIETGEIGYIMSYKGDGFYELFVEDEGQAAYFSLHVEDLELVNDNPKT